MIGNNCHRTTLNNTGDIHWVIVLSVLLKNVPIVLKTLLKLDVICTGPDFLLQLLCYNLYDNFCYKRVGYKYATLEAVSVINLQRIL